MTKADYSQWGIKRNEFAEKEGVVPEVLSMRIKKYGTPFQRKKQPTMWERKYAKTMLELVEELGVHPQTLVRRESTYGDIYRKPMFSNSPNKGQIGDIGKRFKLLPWLCEEHPDYEAWRNGDLFSD